MSKVTPLNSMGRTPEQGRIRLGVKTERAMKSLDTFRFTSPDREAVCQIADLYGGVVEEWKPPRSKQQQWEVITGTSDIRVFLPPDSIHVWYEQWSGGGCQRRCDGVTVSIPVKTPDGMDTDTEPCLCQDEQGPQKCSPYTRLNVILPEIKFGGVWRLESKGWNAANEMPNMAMMLQQMQIVGLMEGRLILEQRSRVSGGQTRHFVVPRLAMDISPTEILSGDARVGSLQDTVTQTVPVLTSGVQEQIVDFVVHAVIDAEVVEGTEGWDKPPAGISVKKNPNPPPKYLPV